jgi:hypothetical protein
LLSTPEDDKTDKKRNAGSTLEKAVQFRAFAPTPFGAANVGSGENSARDSGRFPQPAI